MVVVGRFSRVLSMALEPINKSTVHELARKVSTIKIEVEHRYRGCIAVDETKLRVKKALRMCTNKPLVIVDRGPWYRWALERLGLEYRYERFGLRNMVERFFGYLKQRTRRFYNNINTWKTKSIEDYAVATATIRNLLTVMKT